MPRRVANHVGQVGNLRRIGNPPAEAFEKSATGRFPIGCRMPSCPTKNRRKNLVARVFLPVLIFVLNASANAAIWPEQLGPTHRISAAPADPTTNSEIWKEYGLQATERADYGAFRATAYRFKDTTGAFAAAQWLQASDPKTTTLGNYAIGCAGKCPPTAQLKEWLAAGKPAGLSRAAYPSLDTYLPPKSMTAGSKRYIYGPAALAEFEPRIPASAVAFDFSTEGQLAKYRTPKGEATLAIFSYPTPMMARQQLAELQKVSGAAAKRTGALVAVVFAPDQTAEALLSQINYQASISMDQVPPLVLKPESAAKMLLAIISLAGVVVAFCALSGLAFGLIRVLARKFGHLGANDAMITLHLADK